MPIINTSMTTEGIVDSTSTNTTNSSHKDWSRNIPGVERPVVDKATADFTAALSQLTEAIKGADVQQQVANKSAAEAIDAAGQAKATATRVTGENVAAKADTQAKAREVFSTNLADPNSDLVHFAARRHDTWRAMEDLQAHIADSEKVGFLDDPIGYLVNTVRVPLLKRTYNEMVGGTQELTKRIDTLEMETVAAQNLDTGITRDRALQESNALASAQAAEALAQSRQVLAQGQTMHATMLMQQAALAPQPLEKTLEVARLFMRTESGGNNRSTTTTTSHSESQRTSDLERIGGVAQRTVDAINAKRIAAGAKPHQLLTLDEFAQYDKKQQSRLTANAKLPASWDASPGDSYLWLKEHNLLDSVRESRPEVAQLLARTLGSSAYQAAGTVLRNDQPTVWAKMGPEERVAYQLDAAAKEEFSKYLAGEKRNNLAIPHDSPLAFKPIFAAQQPELAKNWVSGFVKERIAANPALITQPGGVTPQMVLTEMAGRTLAAKNAGDGASIKKMAQELSDFFRTGQQLQWVRSGASSLAYPRPTEFVAGGFMTEATGKALQVWTPAEVEHWAMANAIRFNPTSVMGSRRPLSAMQ